MKRQIIKYLDKKLSEEFSIDELHKRYTIIEQLCNSSVLMYGYKIEFSFGRGLSKTGLGANAGLLKHSKIFISPNWIIKLITDEYNIAETAFLQTVGHELTHKDGDFPILKYGVNYVKFIAYVNEVHADFGSAQKMLNSNREQLLQSMLYKQSQFSNIDKGDYAHPSWEKRICYVKHFNFTKTLIKQIMYDMNCLNDVIIDDVSSYFDEIILH